MCMYMHSINADFLKCTNAEECVHFTRKTQGEQIENDIVIKVRFTQGKARLKQGRCNHNNSSNEYSLAGRCIFFFTVHDKVKF